MIFYNISLILANLILFFAFIIGFKNQFTLPAEKKWFFYYIGFILGIEIILKSCIYLFNCSDTSFLYPLYIFGEFLILTKVFYTGIKIEPKWFVIPIFIGIIILTEGIYLWYNNQDASLGLGKTISHLIIICLAGYSLINILKRSQTEVSIAIIYASLFLYYAISLIFFLLLHQLDTISKFNAYVIWGMNNILSALLYATSLYTFLKSKR